MPSQEQSPASWSGKRRPSGRGATREEKAILCLLTEQTAIPIDQLARFLDLYVADARRIVAGFQALGWVVAEEILAGEYAWVWPTYRGAVLSDTGLKVAKPAIRRLNHTRAINEARLLVTAVDPAGRWVSERQLRRKWRGRPNIRIPDAAFETFDEHGNPERHAIEVELSRKEPEHLRSIIAEHFVRYDAVIYLCSTSIARFMERLELTRDYPTLVIREIVENRRALSRERLSPHSGQLPILRLIGEQKAIPLDQLARFLKLNLVQVERTVAGLEEVGCAHQAQMIDGEAPWVWLSKRGARLAGVGFISAKPRIKALAHVRALNEVRLLFAKKEQRGRWLCGASLDEDETGRRPAAAVVIEGERFAIELELLPRPCGIRHGIAHGDLACYDAVFYFGAPAALPSLEGTKKKIGNSNLFVRPVPNWREVKRSQQTPPKAGHRPSGRVRRLSKQEVVILDLLAEQGAIPMDQLARFLGRDIERVHRLTLRLFQDGFVKRSRPFSNEPDWFWVGTRGARFSTTGLSAPALRLGALPKYRAVNEVRLHLRQELPKARWISGRSLRQSGGKKASLPTAVIETAGERHAIEVRLSRGQRLALETRINRRASEYDSVSLYCAPRPYKLARHALAQRCWPNVAVERIPEGHRGSRRFSDRYTGKLVVISLDEVVCHLRSAVAEGQVSSHRARSMAGYLLLAPAGVPQGSMRAEATLKHDCRALGLILVAPDHRRVDSDVDLGPVDVDAIVDRLGLAVDAGELLPSRARSIAGYLLLGGVGVPQGAPRTIYQLEACCAALGLSALG
jgi:DNA-binding Lrp family transcriptional regulator